MRKQININGISTLSSYEDGDCLSMVNLRKKNGVLKPVTPRKVINTLGYAYDELFVHQLPNTNTNWLGVRSGHLYWIENVTTTKTEHDLCVVASIPQITQIGNVLNVLDSNGLQYLIWYENEYKLINSNFDGEQTDITLGPVKVDLKVDIEQHTYLNGTKISKYRHYYTDDVMYGSDLDAFKTAENVKIRQELASSLVAKGVSISERDGLLTDKFNLACTAIELYDGSYILHSNPVLLCPAGDTSTRYENILLNSIAYDYINKRAVFQAGTSLAETTNDSDKYSIYIANDTSWVGTPDGEYEIGGKNTVQSCGSSQLVNRGTGGTNDYGAVVSAAIYGNELKFKINANIDQTLKPLIKSICIFITPGCRLYDYEKYESLYHSFDNASLYNHIAKPKTNAEIIKELAGNQQFYKVHEIPFDDIATTSDNDGWVTIDLKGKLGDNLVNQEELLLDNFTHHTLLPQKQMVYNSKLHVMDYKTILSRGWPVNYFHAEQGVGQFPTEDTTTTASYVRWAKVKIKTENGISEVVRGIFRTGATYNRKDLSPMLSYPDSRAIEMTLYDLYVTSGQNGYLNSKTVKLTASENQNFAYYIDPELKPIPFTQTSVISLGSLTLPSETTRELIYRNSMKVSAVNNPFYFPSLTTFTVGTGFIRNAGTNAIRMSDGQFGQYDVYVFTSEGIYSLDTGTALSYNRISPASLELPTKDILCSTPFGVIFIGKRGLFVISGQQVDFLTPQLEQEPLTVALNMPSSTNVPTIATIKTWNDWFKEYLTNVTEIVYDNQNNEIIIINPTKDYNFVYNLDSKQIYQQTEVIDKVVGGVYPELLVTEGVNVKDYEKKRIPYISIAPNIPTGTIEQGGMISVVDVTCDSEMIFCSENYHTSDNE